MAQLVDCFPSICPLPGKLGLVVPVIRRFKQQDQESTLILCYIASVRPAAGNILLKSIPQKVRGRACFIRFRN